MKAMAMVSPTTRIQKSPFAAPATASTLSSDIETSATMMATSADPKLIGSRAASSDPDGPPASASSCARLSASSRYIFQHTHKSRMPPASIRPTIASSCIAMAAKTTRSATAPATPQKMTLVRISGATREAAMPTTMALSPATTRSIMTIWARAMSCCERSMESACLSVDWMASRGSPRTLHKRQHGLGIAHEGRSEADEGEGGGHVARRRRAPVRTGAGQGREAKGCGDEEDAEPRQDEAAGQRQGQDQHACRRDEGRHRGSILGLRPPNPGADPAADRTWESHAVLQVGAAPRRPG